MLAPDHRSVSADRGQRLAHVVVQFPDQVAALCFLSRHQPARQKAELRTLFGECLFRFFTG
jgi:hypothetical protein